MVVGTRMKKGALSAIVVFVIGISVQAQPAGATFLSTTGILNDSAVRLREAPSLDARVLGYLNRGEKVDVLGRTAAKVQIGDMNAYWYRIRTSQGSEGWAYGAFIDVTTDNGKTAVQPKLAAAWARTVSEGRFDECSFSAVAVDASGNIYAVGQIAGDESAVFGQGVRATSTAASGNVSVLLVKYSPSGVALWAKTLSAGDGYSTFAAVAVDADGNVYAAGYTIGPKRFDFGNGVTVSGTAVPNSTNSLLVKYSSTGNPLWARTTIEGTRDSSFDSIALDSAGNIYVAGSFYGTQTVGFGDNVTANGALSRSGGEDPASGENVLLVKYSSSGAPEWARTLVEGAVAARFTGVAVDGAGEVYASGGTVGSGTFGFGSGVSVDSMPNSALLVKYDPLGTPRWARTSSGPNLAAFYGITTDVSGNVYAVGETRGNGTYGFGNAVSVVGTDSRLWGNVLLVKYSPAGVVLWARTLTEGTAGASFHGVTIDDSGNIFAVGVIHGNGTFGFGNGVMARGSAPTLERLPVQLSTSDENVLLVKYNSAGEAQWARTLVRGTDAYFSGIAVDGSGDVYAAGGFREYGKDFGRILEGYGFDTSEIGGKFPQATFDFGDGVTVAGSRGSYPLLVKYHDPVTRKGR